MEESESNASAVANVASGRQLVEEIGPHDVMLGRGAPISENEGNGCLRQIVVRRHADYVAATNRNAKHSVAIEIVDAVLRQGGRFLQKATDVDTDSFDGAWEVVKAPNDVIMRKVKQLLRDMGPEARERRAERKRLSRKKPSAKNADASNASEANTRQTSSQPKLPPEPSLLAAEESKMASITVEAAPPLATSQRQGGPGVRAFALPPISSANSPASHETINLANHLLLARLGNTQQNITLRPGDREALFALLMPMATASQPQTENSFGGNPLLSYASNLIRQHHRQQQEQEQHRLLSALFQQHTTRRYLQTHAAHTFLPPPHAQYHQQQLLPQQTQVDPQTLQLLSLLTAPTTTATNPMSLLNAAALRVPPSRMYAAETSQPHDLASALRQLDALSNVSGGPPPSVALQQQQELREGEQKQIDDSPRDDEMPSSPSSPS